MSDDIAIRVKGLGKKYRIAHETAPYKTLGETVTNAVKAPFRRLTGEAPARTTEEFWALKDVSFEVKRGEVVGIIGRNGAGKSTLLKILSRITTPTEGTVEVHGRIGSLLEVGTGFHPELSGRENIYLSGSILGMKRSEIDAKFDEIVKFAEMEKFLDTPVKRYSSGMYVRLAFAVAAHLEPEILIIDEVLAVGDAAFQKKCLGKMGDVAKEGRTVLFVSHNMGAISQLTRNAILLESGKIIQSGKTEKVLTYYENSQEMISSNVYDIIHLNSHYQESLTRDVEFIRVELVGNENSNAIPFGNPITFRFTVRANKSIEKFRFSLTIFQGNGNPVGSVFSTDIRELVDGEIARFDFALHDQRLSQGLYYCGVATGIGDNQTGHQDYHIVNNVLYFNILPQINDYGVQSHWTLGWGPIIFEPPTVKRLYK